MNEHDYEPVPGLPAPLPQGESILWQGAPNWRAFARHAMWMRWITGYFVALMLWGMAAPAPLTQVAISTARLGGLAAVALGLLALYAWLVARTTVYTITTRRVVMRFGVALPITIQIAYSTIEAAGLRSWSDGAGDISLALLPDQRIAYLVLWPHARPWKLAKAQPALRGLSNARDVAQILGRALAASAAQRAKAVKIPVSASAVGSDHLPAVA
jgi:hypothetical protein